jgi:Raf kinase inhibitor-like YbhB/YbcL family protein
MFVTMKGFLSTKRSMSSLLLATACGLGLFVFAAAGADPTDPTPMKIQLTSSAFSEGQPIPPQFAYEDKDLSPALQWSGIPPAAKSLTLICDDPDAPMGTWVHWVIYDLPAATAGLSEGVPVSPELPNGAKQGMNDYKGIGYGGPCPPPGKPHRYYFKLYALDRVLGLKSGATKQELLKAMNGHVLAEGELMGTFKR